ncbi:uncharacterized protein [Diabrotica undecimpunctata]|uniref:uncharacterized protein n=1 Tax=Diabrotica undecimpunctata TaxID=50387 RepID=UPI003B6373A3
MVGEKIRVCKIFFKNTLDISERFVNTSLQKTDEHGFVQPDLRGRHSNHPKLSEELIQSIKDHINSIPRIESHYIRSDSSREYIEGSKTIAELYRDFTETQKALSKDTGKYCTYYDIFTREFNIGFHQPKKDQCDQCLQYANSNNEQKKSLQVLYDLHHEEKILCRNEKKEDRKLIHENNKVVVFDLQATLQSPQGSTSAFYYKSKLNSYNFTMAELTKKEERGKNLSYEKVHCYFWSECDAKRGAVEIGSCILNYLSQLSGGSDVTFFSDNCCGQQKNKYVASVYLYAVTNLNINKITHKFLIKGHSQNEGDNIHSLIEKDIKRNLKSGPIYIPAQYVTIIKGAKKTTPYFEVHELNYDFFTDVKALQEEWGYNFNINTLGESVVWNNIKVIECRTDQPFTLFYKLSYKDHQFFSINVRNKPRKKVLTINEIYLKKAYTQKAEISEIKKRHIKELISKNLIPSFYASFYDALVK